jgi:hypothetical protein
MHQDPTSLTEQARRLLERERTLAQSRIVEISTVLDHLERLVGQLAAERVQLARRLHAMDESLGLTPQISIDALEPGLRGRRLREVAIEVLRQRLPAGEAIHYREWLHMLGEQGIRVGGRDPGATLLTQIARAEDVESVRPRSGLYRLRAR